MSTHCLIRVFDRDNDTPTGTKVLFPCMIYQHADGDPAHALIFIKAFAKRYAKERGHDPEYFIAQFLRHEAFDHQAKMEEKVKLYSKKGNKEIAASYK